MWAARYEANGDQVAGGEQTPILEVDSPKSSDRIVSFAVGGDQELYVLRVGGSSRIQRLEAKADPPQDVHRRLSETGLFEDVPSLTPNRKLTEYEVNVPLWSDGADKRRFVAFPSRRPVILLPGEPPELPSGTVLVKHFSMVMDESDPTSLRHLETRAVVVQDEGVRAASYRWRQDQ